jgi:hypothetical protein
MGPRCLPLAFVGLCWPALAVVGLVGLRWPHQWGAGGQLHFGGGSGGCVADAAATAILVVGDVAVAAAVFVVMLEVRSLSSLPGHGGKNLRQQKMHLVSFIL